MPARASTSHPLEASPASRRRETPSRGRVGRHDHGVDPNASSPISAAARSQPEWADVRPRRVAQGGNGRTAAPRRSRRARSRAARPGDRRSAVGDHDRARLRPRRVRLLRRGGSGRDRRARGARRGRSHLRAPRRRPPSHRSRCGRELDRFAAQPQHAPAGRDRRPVRPRGHAAGLRRRALLPARDPRARRYRRGRVDQRRRGVGGSGAGPRPVGCARPDADRRRSLGRLLPDQLGDGLEPRALPRRGVHGAGSPDDCDPRAGAHPRHRRGGLLGRTGDRDRGGLPLPRRGGQRRRGRGGSARPIRVALGRGHARTRRRRAPGDAHGSEHAVRRAAAHDRPRLGRPRGHRLAGRARALHRLSRPAGAVGSRRQPIPLATPFEVRRPPSGPGATGGRGRGNPWERSALRWINTERRST